MDLYDIVYEENMSRKNQMAESSQAENGSITSLPSQLSQLEVTLEDMCENNDKALSLMAAIRSLNPTNAVEQSESATSAGKQVKIMKKVKKMKPPMITGTVRGTKVKIVPANVPYVESDEDMDVEGTQKFCDF